MTILWPGFQQTPKSGFRRQKCVGKEGGTMIIGLNSPSFGSRIAKDIRKRINGKGLFLLATEPNTGQQFVVRLYDENTRYSKRYKVSTKVRIPIFFQR